MPIPNYISGRETPRINFKMNGLEGKVHLNAISTVDLLGRRPFSLIFSQSITISIFISFVIPDQKNTP